METAEDPKALAPMINAAAVLRASTLTQRVYTGRPGDQSLSNEEIIMRLEQESR